MGGFSRFAICNEIFQGWDFEAACRSVASIGYNAVEIAPFTIAPDITEVTLQRRKELRCTAQESGLEIAGLHWLLVSPKGLHINHPEEAVRRRTVDYLRALVDFCADLGGKVMVFGSPAQRAVHPDLTYEQAWDLALESIAQVVDALEDRGVTLCMEPLPPPETNFLNTAAEAVRFVEEINHPNVRIAADVKSMCAEGRPEDIIRKLGPMTAHFHANDANRRGPGCGDVDFRPIARALKEIGYSGFVSVEVFDYWADPETMAKESLAYLRQCFREQY
ncbi:MAG: sugar phosphate isomerase/epimerase family protein [Armatimonadota bacterium]